MININNNRNNRPGPGRGRPQNKPAQRTRGYSYGSQNLANVNSYNPVRRTVPYKHQYRQRPSPLRVFMSRFLMLIAFTAIIFGAVAGIFFLRLTRVRAPADFRYTIEMLAANGEIARTAQLRLPHEIGFAGNARQFPVNSLMDFMGFIPAGDLNAPTFIRDDPPEHLRFEIGAPVAYINGARRLMPAPSFIHDGLIHAPLDFLLSAFDNISLSYDTLSVRLSDEPYLRISAARALAPIDLTPDILVFLAIHGAGSVDFLSDLSAFERYFDPPPDELQDFLVLVNRTNPLDSDFHPPELVDVADTRGDRAVQQLRLYPARALEAMLIEARAHGHTEMTVTSGFRDYPTQRSLFNTGVTNRMARYNIGVTEATELTALAIAFQGQSEHQTGLAVDVHSITGGGNLQAFGSQPDGIWVAQNAHHFGFIVRYPYNKTHITGIMYEPWHLRYVGRVHATRIFNSGLTFEEYHEQFLQDFFD